MEKIGRKPKAMIVWNKVNPAQHLDKYFKQHEIIFYYGDYGGHKTLRGDIWTIKRQKNTVHPTMKPVELIEIGAGGNGTVGGFWICAVCIEADRSRPVVVLSVTIGVDGTNTLDVAHRKNKTQRRCSQALWPSAGMSRS